MFTVRRNKHNPLLIPTKTELWESIATFNWCPSKDSKKVHAVYRAVGTPELVGAGNRELSVIGYASSKDGIHWENRRPLIKPELPWEKFGCEDPRVTKFEGKYYIFYTALSTFPFTASGIKVALAITRDFKTIEAKHPVTPFNAKAMALFPERINGKIVAVLTAHTDIPPAKIAFAKFDREEDMWDENYWTAWHENIDRFALDVRRGVNDQVEVGAPPIKTDRGWLFIYSHIQNYFSGNKIFGIEALLLDLEHPEIVIGRTKGPLLVPEEIYEQFGHVPKVVFPSGALVNGKNLEIYYGASDTTSAVAAVNLNDLLDTLEPETARKYVVRFEGNPILTPIKNHPWEAKAVYNPAAIELGGKIHIIYRAQSDDDTSTMGYASSKNGLHIDERLDTPIYVPREPFEMKSHPGNSGCEDPRIMKIGTRLFMTYTAYDGTHVPSVAVTSISVKDFLAKKWKWEKPTIITPSEVDDKDSCILPEKINGTYMIFHRIGINICADFLKSLDFSSERVSKCVEVLHPRPGMWDGKKLGIAAPPIKTQKGWLLFYHGISDRSNYRVGAALLDLKNPTIVLARTSDAFLSPEMKYEMEGQVPNVVFPCGAVLRKGTIFIYYGGADSVVAVATLELKNILEALS